MKGISHFATGVALATCFPAVVHAGAMGSLLPMLGGIGGILPDTLDFKFARYFEHYDLEIDPGVEPQAEAIAEALVQAMRRAWESNRPQNVMAHTIRLGADLWREYTIRFEPESGMVAVRIGPLVNTGQVPLPGTTPQDKAARLEVGVPLVHTYSDEYRINIFSGPSFRFVREGDHLHIHFLDWHRRWSHSLTLAAMAGVIVGLLFGLWAGVVFAIGWAGHVLEDQLGHMGSNLFWPFTKGRVPGLGLIHSGESLPNALTVWTALMLILYNLDHQAATPLLLGTPFFPLAVGIPWLSAVTYFLWKKGKQLPLAAEAIAQAEVIAEAEEG